MSGEVEEYGGCVCGAGGRYCCAEPDGQLVICEHDNPESCDCNWCVECINCGAFCGCDV